MEVLVSSKLLSNKLSEFHKENHTVEFVKYCDGKLKLIGSLGVVQIDVVAGCQLFCFNQENARWDWIKDLVNKIDEQPIVLIIYRNNVNIRTQF
jgi:hypothetical protein